MPKRTNKLSLDSTVLVALITTIGVVIGAYLNYKGSIRPHEFAATQTADAPKSPTAIPTPTSQKLNWIAFFESEFPSGYWKEGIHNYLFDADCPFPINSTKENEPSYSLIVTKDAELQSTTVYIRRGGLYPVERSGTSIGHKLHPSQATIVLYGPLASTFENAERLHDECKVRISIDEGEFMDLVPTRIDKIND